MPKMDERHKDDAFIGDEELLSREERLERREANRPDTSLLKPAMSGDHPLFKPGDRVTVERWTTLVLSGSKPMWLDTLPYTVNHIDEVTGIVKAFNEDAGHRSTLSYRDGLHLWFFR